MELNIIIHFLWLLQSNKLISWSSFDVYLKKRARASACVCVCVCVCVLGGGGHPYKNVGKNPAQGY